MAKPGRSFVVNRLTRGDIADVYWLHSLLAGELTARACRHADDDLVTRLEGVLTAWPATELPRSPWTNAESQLQ